MTKRRVTGWLVLSALATGIAAAQSERATSVPNNPFDPPPCTGAVFLDVTCGGLFDAWIERYAADAITGGCGGGNYCPNNPVTRGQMAVFVEKAMRGTSVWSPGDLGNHNTGLGASALLNNTTAGSNTAIGDGALFSQSFDNGGSAFESQNTAVGRETLYSNQPTSTATGFANSAVGYFAMKFNTIGSSNTAMGQASLENNSTGSFNTAFGRASLALNEASFNTAVGSHALWLNDTGFDNTAIGYQAGAREDTFTGYLGTPVTLVPNMTGNYNTFIGITGATGQVNNCTAVGMDAYCVADNQVRLGNFFVNSIGGKVDWSTISDARAKVDIRELDEGLPLVLALKPVSYRYKRGNGRADMGFVAQDVEELLGDAYNVVDPGSDPDRTLSLRYAQLIAPLVKAVQEQQEQIEALRSEVAALRERD